MSDINTVALSGRLGADPEIRYTAKGTAVLSLNIASTTGWGENEKTNWINLVFWDKKAEAAAKHLSKGSKIFIDGELGQESWENKETGKNRSKTRVKVMNWTFGDSKGSGGVPARPTPARSDDRPPPQTTHELADRMEKSEENEIPF